MKKIRFYPLIFCLSLVAGCTNSIGNINDACDILESKKNWYKDLIRGSESWVVPKHTILAFIHQESKFRSNARPPRKKLFGLIPTFRHSSAFGYPQALDQTWRDYQNKTKRHFASRDDFSDSVDFIGWYIDGTRKMLTLPAEDVVAHYLAYHEGRVGYSKGSYKNKQWLLSVASKVQLQSSMYASQLEQCESGLNTSRFLIF